LDRIGHGWMGLVPDQGLASVLFREALEGSELVLSNAGHQRAGHAGIERAVSRARHDVDGDPGVRPDHGPEPKRHSRDCLRLISVKVVRLGPGSSVASLPTSGMTEFWGWRECPLPPVLK